ncbi:MAG: NYN domain-containing protein [Vicinamibacterales bacterium]
MANPDRLNIAVFIDFDNIEIGVRTTLNDHFDVGATLDAIKERGEVVTKIAYADWTRAGEYSRQLTQHAIRLVQRNLTPGGDKNGADINLALDALEMAFTHPHINAYVIVGGDSDFLSLVEKLKQYDKKVFVVGGRAFTSIILQRNCHEFIAYENLTGVRKQPARGDRPAVVSSSLPIAQAFPILRRALKILAEREVTPQTGLLKSTLLQLDSTFSERNYGASSFLDFVEKVAKTGMVQLKHTGRSVMVELNEGFEDTQTVGTRPIAAAEAEAPAPVRPAEPATEADATAVVRPPTESAAEGVRMVGQILREATIPRWPMYLRNLKQVLRAANGGFDERRYGFGGLMDLVRACQRENLIRVERDRRGGLRVFPGSALPPRAGQATGTPAEGRIDGNTLASPAAAAMPSIQDLPPDEVMPDEMMDEMDRTPLHAEPHPVDTTAELLGRAKPRRPSTGSGPARARSTGGGVARGSRKAAAPKPVARRSTRSKKTHTSEEPGS